MKKIIAHRLTHLVAILAMSLVVAYVFFTDIKQGEAVTSIIVGSVEVKVYPNGGAAGTESVVIGYNGTGFRDISGWSVFSGDTEVYTYNDLKLFDGDTFKVCANELAETDCADEWSGGDVWPDDGGSLRLKDANGIPIMTVSYTDGSAGAMARNTLELTETVYEKNDAIRICHGVQEGGKYSNSKAQVASIIDRQKGHVTHELDVIPPFYYLMGSTIGYFEGKNWPQQETFYNNNCE